jgi:hypothetical protein
LRKLQTTDFGVMPKDVLPSSTAVLLKPLSSIERKRNLGTISCGKPLEHRQKSDKIARDDRQEPNYNKDIALWFICRIIHYE